MKKSTFWSLVSLSLPLIVLSRRSSLKGGGKQDRGPLRNRKMIVSLKGGVLRVVEEIAHGQKLIWHVGDGLSEVDITFKDSRLCKCGGTLKATQGHDAVCEVTIPDGSDGEEQCYTLRGIPINDISPAPVEVDVYVGPCNGCKP